MIRVVASNSIDPNRLDEFLSLVKELISETRKEIGCHGYSLYRDSKDPSLLTFIEVWSDQAALQTHSQSAHFVRIVPQLRAFQTKAGELHIYEEIPGLA